MGIKGLWKALKPYVHDGHLSQFRGQRVAIDMYVWLHQSLPGCVAVDEERLARYLIDKHAYEQSKRHNNNNNSNRPHDGRTSTRPHVDVDASSSSSSCSNNSGSNDHDDMDDGEGSDVIVTSSSSPSSPSSSSLSAPSISIDELVHVRAQFIDNVVGKIEALRRFGIVPVCVFDGAAMPMKRDTDAERQQRRRDCFRTALHVLEALYARGRHDGGSGGVSTRAPAYAEALQLLEKSVDICTELAHAVLQVLREQHHVECLVAPYEADAQLSYLCREGYVYAAISEDSDLIAYYCPRILAKLDAYSGRCEVLLPAECAPRFFASVTSALASRKRAHHHHKHDSSSKSKQHDKHDTDKDDVTCTRVDDEGSRTTTTTTTTALQPFTYESFLLACIMSGCDYVPNLRSIGVKTAFKLVAQAHSLPQLLHMVEQQYGFPVDEMQRYRRQLLAAFYCFAHHIVYCPIRKHACYLHPLPHATSAAATTTAASTATVVTARSELVGELWSDDVARRVCHECVLDPVTQHLYTGRYQDCLQTYLQRTRRGQAALTSFAGFEKCAVAKVVMRMGDVVDRAFGSPVRKLREGCGFVGNTTTTTATTTTRRRHVGTSTRSRYFVRHAHALPSSSSSLQNNSSSSSSSSSSNATSATSSSSCSAADTDTVDVDEARVRDDDSNSSNSSSATTQLLGVHENDGDDNNNTSGDSTASGPTSGVAPHTRVADDEAAVVRDDNSSSSSDDASTRCVCPFGYWQCNRAHSIFDQCFVGKDWVRGARPDVTADTTTTDGTCNKDNEADDTTRVHTTAVNATTTRTTCVIGKFKAPQSTRSRHASSSSSSSSLRKRARSASNDDANSNDDDGDGDADSTRSVDTPLTTRQSALRRVLHRRAATTSDDGAIGDFFASMSASARRSSNRADTTTTTTTPQAATVASPLLRMRHERHFRAPRTAMATATQASEDDRSSSSSSSSGDDSTRVIDTHTTSSSSSTRARNGGAMVSDEPAAVRSADDAAATTTAAIATPRPALDALMRRLAYTSTPLVPQEQQQQLS